MNVHLRFLFLHFLRGLPSSDSPPSPSFSRHDSNQASTNPKCCFSITVRFLAASNSLLKSASIEFMRTLFLKTLLTRKKKLILRKLESSIINDHHRWFSMRTPGRAFSPKALNPLTSISDQASVSFYPNHSKPTVFRCDPENFLVEEPIFSECPSERITLLARIKKCEPCE